MRSRRDFRAPFWQVFMRWGRGACNVFKQVVFLLRNGRLVDRACERVAIKNPGRQQSQNKKSSLVQIDQLCIG